MHIPSNIVKNGDFSNANNKNSNVTIFQDKIVNKKLSPLLYNIELGLREAKATMQNTNSNIKTTMDKTSSDRAYLAKDMLVMTNIKYENIPKSFSLLEEEQANNAGLQNVNIMDKEQFEQTFNSTVQADDKFTDVNDPFYNLDENETSSKIYLQEKDVNGTLMQPPDLSKIASGIVTLNMSPNYRGRSKYFIPHTI